MTIGKSPPPAVDSNDPVVIIVDDDPSVRETLGSLFRSVNLNVRLLASPAELLENDLSSTTGCLVLDIRMPGLSGLDLQNKLAEASVRLPIIFITGHGDIPMTVRAMKAGAVDFLAKPFRDQDILDAVTTAIQRDRKRRNDELTVAAIRDRFERLSPQEKKVMGLVTRGLMNKQIAAEIGLSEITVKIYRSHLMKKMAARSLADLVKMSEALNNDFASLSTT